MKITPERLREMRCLIEAAPIRYAMTAVECCESAASEIERLRAALMEIGAPQCRTLTRATQISVHVLAGDPIPPALRQGIL